MQSHLDYYFSYLYLVDHVVNVETDPPREAEEQHNDEEEHREAGDYEVEDEVEDVSRVVVGGVQVRHVGSVITSQQTHYFRYTRWPCVWSPTLTSDLENLSRLPNAAMSKH